MGLGYRKSYLYNILDVAILILAITVMAYSYGEIYLYLRRHNKQMKEGLFSNPLRYVVIFLNIWSENTFKGFKLAKLQVKLLSPIVLRLVKTWSDPRVCHCWQVPHKVLSVPQTGVELNRIASFWRVSVWFSLSDSSLKISCCYSWAVHTESLPCLAQFDSEYWRLEYYGIEKD